ncbi:hypothetical protein HGA11_31530 [Mycolicibacterium septicum DSM 44393]|uniref:Type I restriction modification DNA specificity domain-containing protein n=1 Tax=Mycolicibacterium septicum DSM 44393 TaxID=1341646 RepID=A0A7X6MX51_9MYCO|nr:restriction endonuclease subunit S [Mycolicibacterium septicum]NKZ15511.1 hypothetical protein [Mycolicibacterium septicum DSM 44393]
MRLDLDKSAWKRVVFGDVVRNVNQTLRNPDEAGIDRIIAMEHLDPGELKISRWGSTENGTTFIRRVTPGQTLFGKRRAYQRKIAYAEFAAICSGDIYTFEADETQMLSEFLPFLVMSNEFFDHALGTSAGSLSPRTNWRDLANFAFDLPPLDEQDRIANLLWAVESHHRALSEERRALESALGVFLDETYRAAEGPEVAIDSLCAHIVGGVWGSPEGENDVDVLALGPRVYASGEPELTTDGSPVRSVSESQAASRLVRPGDIVLERSGGTFTQLVGRVVIAGDVVGACIPTDFQRLLRPAENLVEPRYLFWRLRRDWLAGVPRDYSKRTTNIANLSVKQYLARKISLPAKDAQLEVLDRISEFQTALATLNDEANALGAFNSALLDMIFGGG